MTGRYFEDFSAGDEIVSAGMTLTLESMIAYASMYDPQYFHIDVEAAKQSHFGGLIASGFQTFSIGFRLFLDTGVLQGTSMGSNTVDELRWVKPVRPGDTLHTVTRIVDTRTSQSKPDRGIVRANFTTLNQRDEVVMTFATTVFVARRPS